MSYETILPLICTSGAAVDASGYAGGDGYSCETGTIYQSLYGPLVPHVFENGCGAILYFGLPCLWPPKNTSVITALALQPFGTLSTAFGDLKIGVSYDGGTTWHTVCIIDHPFSGDVVCTPFSITLDELSDVLVNVHIGETLVGPDGCGPDCAGSPFPFYGCVCPPDTFIGGVELVITSSAELELPTEPTMVITEECCCVCT